MGLALTMDVDVQMEYRLDIRPLKLDVNCFMCNIVQYTSMLILMSQFTLQSKMHRSLLKYYQNNNIYIYSYTALKPPSKMQVLIALFRNESRFSLENLHGYYHFIESQTILKSFAIESVVQYSHPLLTKLLDFSRGSVPIRNLFYLNIKRCSIQSTVGAFLHTVQYNSQQVSSVSMELSQYSFTLKVENIASVKCRITAYKLKDTVQQQSALFFLLCTQVDQSFF